MRLRKKESVLALSVVLLVCAVGGALSRAEGPAQSAVSSGGDRAPIHNRILRKEVTVSATLEEVWVAWTTSEGIASFFSPESNIELRVGGPYELFMGGKEARDERGKSGTQGCKLLSYLPKEMLSFEWNFPPEIPSLRYRDAKTHVVLLFDEVGRGMVRVRFAQLGWQEGEDWEQGYAYFDSAWTWVFEQLQKHFAGGRSAAEGERPS